ncbi:MAG: alpha/beta hydrolase [Oscillibacter sp.]|nr:alpha/beta hydrolase [Oscillibacter sp.]
MESFYHNGLRLFYRVTGEGRPLVFLHGMGGSTKQIDAVYDPIPGVQLITMDQQGHGESDADWETFSFDSLADDVIALLDRLSLERAAIAGISMGAAVSLNLAARYPQRVEKLLLIRNAWTDQPMSEEVQIAYRDLGLALAEGSVERFYASEGWRIVAESSDYTRGAFVSPFRDPSSLKNWKKYLLLPPQKAVSSVEVLRQLTVPVHLLANRQDLCHPFSYGVYLSKQIPHAGLTEIPDKDSDAAGHKAAVNRALRAVMGEEKKERGVL